MNGDVYTDYPFMRLRKHVLQEASAHLVLVDNPPHHLSGDFLLNPESTVSTCLIVTQLRRVAHSLSRVSRCTTYFLRDVGGQVAAQAVV